MARCTPSFPSFSLHPLESPALCRSAKHSHYLQMRKHEKVDKRRTRGRYCRAIDLISPPGVTQRDIRLDFGKLSPRITRYVSGGERERESRRCLPAVSSEFREIVASDSAWKYARRDRRTVDTLVRYLDGALKLRELRALYESPDLPMRANSYFARSFVLPRDQSRALISRRRSIS